MPIFIQWNLAHNFSVFDDIMSQTLDQLSEPVVKQHKETRSTWVPVADMYETETSIVIRVELAGISKESLEIGFQGGYLLLQGERPFNEAMKSATIHQIERRYGPFQRKLLIPISIDSQQISASYTHGILHICLPKQQQRHTEYVNVPVDFT